MYLNSRNEQLRVTRPSLVDFVADNDLVHRFLQLYQLAKLGGLAALPLRITSVVGSKTPMILPSLRVAMKNVCFGLTHHLLNQRHHLIQSLAVSRASPVW